MGFTLNSITLLALALSVGIVIDDAIVVLENIYRYIEEKDCTPFEAALAATKEIGLAVLSITLSLIAVFLPIAFMGGIVGRFLKSFGITMSATILVSMIISFSLTPMLAARWLKLKRLSGGRRRRQRRRRRQTATAKPAAMAARHAAARSRGGVYHWIESGYLALLRFSLRRRWVVVLCVVGMLALVPVLLKARPQELPARRRPVGIRGQGPRPEGTSLEATFVLLDRISRDVRRLGGVEYTLTSVADSDQRIANEGTVYVRMAPLGRRRFDQFEMMNYVRQKILPPYRKQDLRISVNPVAIFSGGGMTQADVQFMIAGPDMRSSWTSMRRR